MIQSLSKSRKTLPCISYGAIKKTGLTRSFWKHSLLHSWQPALNFPRASGKLCLLLMTMVLAHLLAWAPSSLDSTISLMIWSSPPPPTLLLPLLLFSEQPHDLFFFNLFILYCSFPDGCGGKESACNAGDSGLIPRSRRSPGEGNGCPLQYSWLENSMDRGARRATVHEVTRVGHDWAADIAYLTMLW